MEIWQIIVSICAGSLTLLAFVKEILRLRKGVKEKTPWEHNKHLIEEHGKAIDNLTKAHERHGATIKGISLSIHRQEILMLIYNQPDNEAAIFAAYDTYKKMGGNSYMDKIIDDYRESRPAVIRNGDE